MQRGLPILGRDEPHAARDGPPLGQSAFRPFFLAAGLAAVALSLGWMALLEGWLTVSLPLPPFHWHGHEMIFGFALAVISGFLLTASRVWTGLPTVSGTGLAAVVGLWVAGRALSLGGASVGALAAGANIALPLVVAALIGRPIVKARSWRNVPFIGLLVAMAAADAAVWSDALGFTEGLASRALWVALDAVLVMIVLVGGRIVPMFTRNATGARIRRPNPLDVLGPAAVAAVMVAHATTGASTTSAAVSIGAGALNAARLFGWGGARALRVPFVGVLHTGYGLVAVGLLLEGAAEFTQWRGVHPGRHVMALGGLALMSLGMMTRVSLGHTGRPLHPPASTPALYALVVAATSARAAASFAPEHAFVAWWIAVTLFAAAFGGFVATYAGILVAPRVDGKPG